MVVREIRAKIGLGRRCVESMVEYAHFNLNKSNSLNIILVQGGALVHTRVPTHLAIVPPMAWNLHDTMPEKLLKHLV